MYTAKPAITFLKGVSTVALLVLLVHIAFAYANWGNYQRHHNTSDGTAAGVRSLINYKIAF